MRKVIKIPVIRISIEKIKELVNGNYEDKFFIIYLRIGEEKTETVNQYPASSGGIAEIIKVIQNKLDKGKNG